jgi:hypothetical protein
LAPPNCGAPWPQSKRIDNLREFAYKEPEYIFCRGGETGRRTGLKIQRGLLHAGSIPAPGTNEIKGLANLVIPFFGAEIVDCAHNCVHLRFKVGFLLLCS